MRYDARNSRQVGDTDGNLNEPLRHLQALRTGPPPLSMQKVADIANDQNPELGLTSKKVWHILHSGPNATRSTVVRKPRQPKVEPVERSRDDILAELHALAKPDSDEADALRIKLAMADLAGAPATKRRDMPFGHMPAAENGYSPLADPGRCTVCRIPMRSSPSPTVACASRMRDR